MKTKPTLAVSAMLLLLFSLAGCGKNKDHPVTDEKPPPITVPDTFIAAVQAVVASTADDAEPGSIDAIAATAPEDNEPIGI